MEDRLRDLESLSYEEEYPFFADDLKEALEEIYHPFNVDDISNMDNGMSYEYLVALNNKGSRSESIHLGNGIYMETLDRAVEEKDLYYLYVQVSTLKPFATRSIWKYLKGSEDLYISENPILEDHQKPLEDFSEFLDRYKLVYVSDEDMEGKVEEDGQPISFYKKYFDDYNEF